MNRITLCPAIEAVFYDQPDEYKKHFKPLATIGLSLIDKYIITLCSFQN